jgi:plastocyanin
MDTGGMMGSGGGMMGGNVPGGYGYQQFPPAVQPTPSGPAPAPAEREIQITAVNFRFEPSEIAVNPGETVRFVVTNKDTVLHNFGSQEAGIAYIPLPASATQTVTWTAPNRVGTYTADCSLHPGMDLTITIHEQPSR